MRRHAGLAGLVALVVALAASCVLPIEDLGGPTSTAGGINASGVVVGASELPGSTPEDRIEHAFLRRPDGTVTDLGTLPGHDTSAAMRINDGGTVVGTSGASDAVIVAGQPSATAPHATRWAPSGAITDLGTLGGPTSEPRGIDDQGRIIGVADTASGPSKAFLFDPAVGHMTQLPDLPGGLGSIALGMNDVGDAVGYQWVGDPQLPRAVRWDLDLGTATDLTTTLGPWIASDINDSGAVIGLAPFGAPGSITQEAVVLPPGASSFVRLNAGNFSLAIEINDAGVVVGYRTDGPDGNRAFRWEQMTGPVALTIEEDSIAFDINDNDQIVGVADRSASFLIPPAPPPPPTPLGSPRNVFGPSAPTTAP